MTLTLTGVIKIVQDVMEYSHDTTVEPEYIVTEKR